MVIRPRTAVIGAGMAGLTCATDLRAAGHSVVVFDKARGPGGRMSTRRLALETGEAAFDHGASSFTAAGADFRAQVEAWMLQGLAAPWAAAGPGCFVGLPAMNTPLKAMAAELETRWTCPVAGLSREGSAWRLEGAAEVEGLFDRVVLAIPAEQAAVLLATVQPAFAALAQASPSAPCWSLMVVFERPVESPLAVLTGGEVVAWAGREASKPGRAGPEAWVIQACPIWSRENLEITAEEAASRLLRGFEVLLGRASPRSVSTVAHRWRYARPEGPPRDVLWDPETGLGVCGDWLGGGSVEGAWRSGRQLASLLTER
ncbi:NAD(P)/FAD-dependent oxidoreductase [Caulobacter sp. DWR1-3-2b1]|uniref:NAD(P)/FAD-dependent oxidoreductase n=1 Tax=Caulobacter sp. DWR1-3-2b1 TaxID=2804670 RepID=UPI003CF061CA